MEENKKEEQNKKKEPEIPSSPKTKVSLRTMDTDKTSLKKSGGEPPRPVLVELDVEPEKEEEKEGEKNGEKKQKSSTEPLIKEGIHKGVKIGIFLFGLGVFLFFFFTYVLPLISFKPIPKPSISSPTIPESTIPKSTISQEEQKIQPSSLKEISLKGEKMLISSLTIDNIKEGVKNTADTLKEGEIKVIVFEDSKGIINSNDFLMTLFEGSSQIKKEDLQKIFEHKFFGFLYKEKEKVYLGYVFSFKPDIVQIQTRALIDPILEDKDRALVSKILWRDLKKEDKLYHYYLENYLICSTYNIDEEFIKGLLK